MSRDLRREVDRLRQTVREYEPPEPPDHDGFLAWTSATRQGDAIAAYYRDRIAPKMDELFAAGVHCGQLWAETAMVPEHWEFVRMVLDDTYESFGIKRSFS